ncbi:hypothetical protein HB770_15720 [Rhizobium leguminosarum bv. viciae]|uniref:Uncharacterized protein n=1 Tax=Rhizobium leguminosarum bv. viciae TaxID=387 RepID=A0A7G6RH26_RHILV|nr:hypothetical protein HB770_15720 [Rhizobium leguminosarum bv. viciae]
MSKTNARELQKRAEQQVKNTGVSMATSAAPISANSRTEKPPRTAAMTAPRHGPTTAIEIGRLPQRV